MNDINIIFKMKLVRYSDICYFSIRRIVRRLLYIKNKNFLINRNKCNVNEDNSFFFIVKFI